MRITEELVIGLIFAFIAIYSLYLYILAILFYKSHNWDFKRDFGHNIYGGDMPDDDAKLTPALKFFIGYPIIILSSAVTSILLIF